MSRCIHHRPSWVAHAWPVVTAQRTCGVREPWERVKARVGSVCVSAESSLEMIAWLSHILAGWLRASQFTRRSLRVLPCGMETPTVALQIVRSSNQTLHSASGLMQEGLEPCMVLWWRGPE